MSEKHGFSTEILEDWKEKLAKKNIIDAEDYLKYAQDKIVLAVMDLNAYYYILEHNREKYMEWNDELFNRRQIGHMPDNNILYFNTKVPIDLMLEKVCTNLFHSLHSFFDSYAHFLYRYYYSTKKFPNRLSFYGVINKMKGKSELDKVRVSMEKYVSKDIYEYIQDIDNINKHLGIVGPKRKVILNDGTIEINMPDFEKGNRQHDIVKLGDIMEDAYELVVSFYNEITRMVFS